MKNRKSKIDSIDIAKFIGSILIFAMHFTALNDYPMGSITSQIIARWAVPFFFLSSAYFLFRKSEGCNISKEVLYKYIYRIGSLYLAWLIFNLPSVYLIRLRGSDLADPLTWLLFIKNSILSSTFTGSWYLTSCIFSAWLIYWLSERYNTKTIILISFSAYVVCCFSSLYNSALPDVLAKGLSFLCFPLNLVNGCFYFSLGKYISENEKMLIMKVPIKKSAFFALVFYGTFVLEIIYAKCKTATVSTDVAFSLAPLAVALLLFCIQIPYQGKNTELFRKASTIIYCCQGNVMCFRIVLSKLGIHTYLMMFFASITTAFVICFVIISLQRHTNWKWVKALT